MPPVPSGQVFFFPRTVGMSGRHQNELIGLCESREISLSRPFTYPMLMARLALWELELPLDDPLLPEIVGMTRMTVAELQIKMNIQSTSRGEFVERFVERQLARRAQIQLAAQLSEQEDNTTPEPSYQVSFFPCSTGMANDQKDKLIALCIARGISTAAPFSYGALMARLALWEFNLPLDDPLFREVRDMARMSLTEMQAKLSQVPPTREEMLWQMIENEIEDRNLRNAEHQLRLRDPPVKPAGSAYVDDDEFDDDGSVEIPDSQVDIQEAPPFAGREPSPEL